MLVDARDLARGSVLRGDVCVIGAGAAGITMAKRLSESGRSVVLCESGGREPDADTQALYEGERTGEPFYGGLTSDTEVAVDQTRLRYFGGSTNHWAGLCRPLDPIDFERRDDVENSGWPFDFSAIEP